MYHPNVTKCSNKIHSRCPERKKATYNKLPSFFFLVFVNRSNRKPILAFYLHFTDRWALEVNLPYKGFVNEPLSSRLLNRIAN